MFRKTLTVVRRRLGIDSRQRTDHGDDGSEAHVSDGGSEVRTQSQLFAETGLEPAVYVEHLLSRNDGRLRQSDVRDIARLSPSTTSRLLSEMEAEGQVIRITDGREKVVCLPEYTPDLADGTAD